LLTLTSQTPIAALEQSSDAGTELVVGSVNDLVAANSDISNDIFFVVAILLRLFSKKIRKIYSFTYF